MSKGSRRRPRQVSRLEEALRWEIWRESDPKKKTALMRELEQIRENEKRWADAKKNSPHLWGSTHEEPT